MEVGPRPRTDAERPGCSPASIDCKQGIDPGGDLTARRTRAVPLTPQQESVLELASQGMTNDEIGHRLFITESTVRFHLQKLKAKFGARSKTDLIARAIRAGAIAPAAENHDPE